MSRSASRRGFTVIELLTTLAIVGILSGIALPKYHFVRVKAQAVDVVASMRTVRDAAFNYNGTAGNWPANSALGVIPPGLGTYLPGSFSFVGTGYQIAWQTSAILVPVKRASQAVVQQMVQASFTDGTLCQSAYGLVGGAKNADVVGLCSNAGGTLTWYVDR